MKIPESVDHLIHIIEALLQQPVAAGDVVFDYLPGGYSNENFRFDYLGSTYVLRVTNRSRPFVDRALERDFYRQPVAGITTPELVAYDTGTGHMLTRFEPGELLADSPPGLEAIASYLKPFHEALPGSTRAYDPLFLARTYLSADSVPGYVARIAERTWQPAFITTCHNDLNPWNIIQSEPGRWVTLDWEWYGRNDPLFDLITLHEGLTVADGSFDENSLARLISLWTQDPVTESRLEQCLSAFWLREFAWAWSERSHGNEREEIQVQIDTAADRLAAFSD